MDEKFGERLIAFRNKKGLSQDELSQKLGVSRQSISNWENGTSQPSIEFVKKLSEIYEVTVDDLLNCDKSIEDCYKKKEESTFKKEEKKDDRGSRIRIDKNGIFINDADDGDSIKFEFGGDMEENIKEKVKSEVIDNVFVDQTLERRKKALYKSIESSINLIFILGSIIAYLILGFLLKNGVGWSKWWILMVFSLVPGETFRAIAFKKPENFPICFVATGIYCTLGVFMNLWHPTWIIFLSIPVYYIVVSSIKSIIKNAKKAKMLK